MKVTFPHMGNAYIPCSALLEELGAQAVVPPPCSSRTLEIGVRLSPEFACLPLKINVGNFVEAISRGADTVIMGGGWGPCRFGYYAQLEKEILEKAGYPCAMLVIESPDNHYSELIGTVKDLKGRASWLRLTRAVRFAWLKVKSVDVIEQEYYRVLAGTGDKAGCEKAYRKALADLHAASSRQEIEVVEHAALTAFARLPQTGGQPLKIGIVGEIYSIIEPFANGGVMNHLGRLGVHAVRPVTMTQWANDHLFGGLLKAASCRDVMPLSVPYVNYWVGGHGRETVAYSVKMAREGIGGIIQIGPLTCMPEIVAQSVLKQVQHNEGVPIMTLYFDEHTGDAGLVTRLEAFADMIQWQKVHVGG